MRVRLVLATANPHKMTEIEEIVTPILGGSVEIMPRPSWVGEIAETGATLEENARLKARGICLATGEISVADDTGLEVAVLEGAPGVYSARYAGDGASYDENVAKLLAELDGIDDRRAVFVTVALCAFPDGSELVARGEVDGTIARERLGAAGFGYDPVFVADEAAPQSFAELSSTRKHEISHRGRAFRTLCALLAARLEGKA
jgi:XTP/dITP diphosphohydrolase